MPWGAEQTTQHHAVRLKGAGGVRRVSRCSPYEKSIYLLVVTTCIGSNQSVHYFPRDAVTGQSGRNEQVSQTQRLSRTIERATNNELKGFGRHPAASLQKILAFFIKVGQV